MAESRGVGKRSGSHTGRRDAAGGSHLAASRERLSARGTRQVVRTRSQAAAPWERNAGSLCGRSEEHTSELQSLMRISYAVFCLKKKKQENNQQDSTTPG